ncbi:MAG: MHYT domain-containing protein [Zhengella sp.]|uniref:MHYT domain-containing protein n=1 Tax=Zhengella sp. TaxID=2282762 RepID=UPI001DAD4C9E|nr:LytTR family transcriptional regulator DNA-binding domain-containing protein [Notoacmeibacter sp.]MCC0027779.1 LytTR family transcriptional regulator DNA-binding domain-containing protein [Brucellaceae bacterium]
MLEYSHDWRLVMAAFAIALMAGFTGLSLTRGASRLEVGRRKAVVSMASVALGGGIWSMHFVAMLGLQLPILYFYDVLTTLISALVAILMTGVALLILHFRERSAGNLALAGAVIGLGIVAMHYIGMSGMELCQPVYTPFGLGGAFVASVALSVLAVRVAYSERGRRNIVLGTVCFGTAVVLVHFIAMAGTGFLPAGVPGAIGPAISNETLAILVTLSTFLISAAFLLTGITFTPPAGQRDASGAAVAAPLQDREPRPPVQPHSPGSGASLRVPHEKGGKTFFLDPAAISAVRAEGHYTRLHVGAETLFCPWSISEAQERLAPAGFMRVHRSYLLNPAHVVKFERLKDSGQCTVQGAENLWIPVSRTRLSQFREELGL